MNNRDEVKAFLSSRRAKITPERAGLSNYSRSRRVLGLRRSEVADLAGVSVEYYAQLERGNIAGVSESVLDALCGRYSWTRLSGNICSTWPAQQAPHVDPAAGHRLSGSVPASPGYSRE